MLQNPWKFSFLIFLPQKSILFNYPVAAYTQIRSLVYCCLKIMSLCANVKLLPASFFSLLFSFVQIQFFHRGKISLPLLQCHKLTPPYLHETKGPRCCAKVSSHGDCSPPSKYLLFSIVFHSMTVESKKCNVTRITPGYCYKIFQKKSIFG